MALSSCAVAADAADAVAVLSGSATALLALIGQSSASALALLITVLSLVGQRAAARCGTATA